MTRLHKVLLSQCTNTPLPEKYTGDALEEEEKEEEEEEEEHHVRDENMTAQEPPQHVQALAASYDGGVAVPHRAHHLARSSSVDSSKPVRKGVVRGRAGSH